MKPIKIIVLFLLLLTAPFAGMVMGLAEHAKTLQYTTYDIEALKAVKAQLQPLSGDTVEVIDRTQKISTTLEAYIETFSGQSLTLESEIERSKGQEALSDDIYERRITSVLGDPVRTHRTPQVEIKLFELEELDYRGYMAKVKLFDSHAFDVVLAEDEVGGYETTSSMAMRNRAMLAINGGGFGTYTDEAGTYTSMIGATVSGGQVIQSFIPKDEPLFFAGIDEQGSVVGTIPASQEDVDALSPVAGVSFIPVLLKNGVKQDLPAAWANTKHPRTVLGRYANDDLLLIVIDGRQAFWSKGVTLEHIQDKLLELGVQDAYNLDGGGSSTIYYNGQVLNKPSDGTERPVANAIIIKP
jgi:exopolysaccharide biosynthesis protein